MRKKNMLLMRVGTSSSELKNLHRITQVLVQLTFTLMIREAILLSKMALLCFLVETTDMRGDKHNLRNDESSDVLKVKGGAGGDAVEPAREHTAHGNGAVIHECRLCSQETLMDERKEDYSGNESYLSQRKSAIIGTHGSDDKCKEEISTPNKSVIELTSAQSMKHDVVIEGADNVDPRSHHDGEQDGYVAHRSAIAERRDVRVRQDDGREKTEAARRHDDVISRLIEVNDKDLSFTADEITVRHVLSASTSMHRLCTLILNSIVCCTVHSSTRSSRPLRFDFSSPMVSSHARLRSTTKT